MTNIWQIHPFPARGLSRVWHWASPWSMFTIVLSPLNATCWHWSLIFNTITIVPLGRVSLHYSLHVSGYRVTLLLSMLCLLLNIMFLHWWEVSVRINLPLFSTVVRSNICMFLSWLRYFVYIYTWLARLSILLNMMFLHRWEVSVEVFHVHFRLTG